MAEIDLYKKAREISSRVYLLGTPLNDGSINESKGEGDIESIDADAHETFTLEEMRALIINYRMKDKDFLIARVTTPDPENEDHIFNFYYSASEINRVLFRFESSRKLLHRMKVKNPLNNMYIIGQVFYYKISIQEVDKSIIEYYFNFKQNNKSIHDIFGNSTDKTKTECKRLKDCLDIPKKQEVPSEKVPGEVVKCINRGILPLPAKVAPEKKIEYFARFFATDDDFLLKADVRDYFRKNALEAEDDFLYEIDRTRNDFIALLDEDSIDAGEDVSDWRRIFSAHVSLLAAMLFVCMLLGGAGVAFVFLPVALVIFVSFIFSLFYVLCCRRSTFDTMAVNSFGEEDMSN